MMLRTHIANSIKRITAAAAARCPEATGASVLVGLQIPIPKETARKSPAVEENSIFALGRTPGTISMAAVKNRKMSVETANEAQYAPNRIRLLRFSLRPDSDSLAFISFTVVFVTSVAQLQHIYRIRGLAHPFGLSVLDGVAPPFRRFLAKGGNSCDPILSFALAHDKDGATPKEALVSRFFAVHWDSTSTLPSQPVAHCRKLLHSQSSGRAAKPRHTGLR